VVEPLLEVRLLLDLTPEQLRCCLSLGEGLSFPRDARL
jgi:hypothetical protein